MTDVSTKSKWVACITTLLGAESLLSLMPKKAELHIAVDEQVIAFLNFYIKNSQLFILQNYLFDVGGRRANALSLLNLKKNSIQKLYRQQHYYTSYQEVDIFSNGTFAINNVLYLEKFNP